MVSLEEIGFTRVISKNVILGILIINFSAIGYLFAEIKDLHKENDLSEKDLVKQLITCDSMRVVDFINLRLEARKEKDELMIKLMTELHKKK